MTQLFRTLILFPLGLLMAAVAGPVGAGIVAGEMEEHLTERQLMTGHNIFMLLTLAAALKWSLPLLAFIALFGLIGPPIAGRIDRRRELLHQLHD